jgi:cytochrome c-type biogenesis protein CcmH/NrfG
MTREEFEQAYDRLAAALDAAGPEDAHKLAFLARLALVQAAASDDLAAFEQALAAAGEVAGDGAAGRPGRQEPP